jgi:hypothetical protein
LGENKNELDELTLKWGGKTYRSRKYWWEDDDFYFVTENETYCIKGMYVTDIKYEGLDYTSSEEVTIEPKLRYTPNSLF